MTRKQELIIDGCKLLGLSNDETISVFQILRNEKEFSDMLDWLIENIESKPTSVEVIVAAGMIQMKNSKL